MMGRFYLSLILLFYLFVGPCHSLVANLDVTVGETDGSFQVSLDGKVWFNSGPIWVKNNGMTLSTSSNGGLKLHEHLINDDAVGELGPFLSHIFMWKTASGDFQFNTYINIYSHRPVVVFRQEFVTGATKTGATYDNSTLSSFPTILMEDQTGLDLGYLSFFGGQISSSVVDRWSLGTEIYHKDDGGFPLVIFDSKMKNTAVLSPLNTFMSASTTYSFIHPSIGFGIISSVDEVPPGYIYETILVAGHNVTGTMSEWGKLLLKTYGKDDSYRKTDLSLNYLGYWTDNGACYYHNTGSFFNYEDVVIAVKDYADKEGIPFQYIQLDDWWYYWGTTNGVKNWTAMPSVFSHNLTALQAKIGWPIFAHNKYWDYMTDYAKQNGGPFNFIFDEDTKKVGIPDDEDFWPYLLSTAKEEWGLFVYEQDFLLTSFGRVSQLRSDLNLGRRWLMQMGNAAQMLDLRIQYCMAWTRHVLQSVEIPVVTQVRASRDYLPGRADHGDQWAIGDSSILADAVGLAPSKDNFHSSQIQDRCKFNTPEPNPLLEVHSAALSGSIIGPSDTVGYMDKDLIMSTCMSNGRLLKPTRIGLSLDSTFLYRAFGTDGPNGIVTVAYSEISEYTFYFILAVNLEEQYHLQALELPPSRNFYPQTDIFYNVAFRYKLGGNVTTALNVTLSVGYIPLKPCGESDFQYWVMSPIIEVFDGWFTVILGELDKVITLSETRFVRITKYKFVIILDMIGTKGEIVNVSFMDALSAKVYTVSCTIGTAGTASLKGNIYNTFECSN